MEDKSNSAFNCKDLPQCHCKSPNPTSILCQYLNGFHNSSVVKTVKFKHWETCLSNAPLLFRLLHIFAKQYDSEGATSYAFVDHLIFDF